LALPHIVLKSQFLSVKTFSSGLKYLGPSQNFISGYYNLIVGEVKKDKFFDIILSIEVKYKSMTKKKYVEKILINFRELEGVYQLGKQNLFSIAQSLEKIEKTLHDITLGFMKMKVDIYNSVDREIEENRIKEIYEENNEESQ
jgi:CRISPR/Cas system CSM-associated protein Csm2 small subunit